MVSRLRSVTDKRKGGSFVKITHREARCCSGSWACSPQSEHSFLTELCQQPSDPSKGRRGKKCNQSLEGLLYVTNHTGKRQKSNSNPNF